MRTTEKWSLMAGIFNTQGSDRTLLSEVPSPISLTKGHRTEFQTFNTQEFHHCTFALRHSSVWLRVCATGRRETLCRHGALPRPTCALLCVSQLVRTREQRWSNVRGRRAGRLRETRRERVALKPGVRERRHNGGNFFEQGWNLRFAPWLSLTMQHFVWESGQANTRWRN